MPLCGHPLPSCRMGSFKDQGRAYASKRNSPAGSRGENRLKRRSEREVGTVPCENLSQKHFSVGVAQRESKTPVLCPLLFCVTSVSVPSNQGNFAILPLLEELWAQLFEGVFHNLTFVSRLRGWPWLRSEPEQGDHQSSWLLLHSPESSFPTELGRCFPNMSGQGMGL